MAKQDPERSNKDQAEVEEPEENSGIKPIQVAAAALAAVTAAFVGSSLGVYGTILGAGIMSVATTVGSEVYLRSLRRTKEAARRTKMLVALGDPRLRQGRSVPVTVEPAAGSDDVAPIDEADPADTAMFTPGGDDEAGNGRRFGRLRWPLIVGTSLLAFVIGMLVLTGFELTTGNAVSGGEGNTVGKLIGGGSGQDGQHETPGGSDGDVRPTDSSDPEQGSEDDSAETSTSEPGTPTESSPATESSQPSTGNPPSSQSSPPPADPGEDAGGAGSGSDSGSDSGSGEEPQAGS